MIFDNNAGRLHALLVKGKGIPGNIACADAWQKVLGATDENSLIRRVGSVMTLVDDTYNAVVSLYPHRTTEHTGWRNNLRSAFAAQQLNGPWSSFITVVKQTTIDQLSTITDLLSNDDQVLLESEDVVRARHDIQRLLNDVLASRDIDRDIKRYIVRMLNKLMLEIDDYLITGIAPVIDSIEAVYGHVVSAAPFREFVQKNPLGSRLLTVLQGTANLATAYPMLKEGAASIMKYIKG